MKDENYPRDRGKTATGWIIDEEKWQYYRDRYKRNNKKAYQKLKLEIFRKISGKEKPECVNCHCDYLPVLEINHKNGGGPKAIKDAGGRSKYFKLLREGKISTIDLEITCRVCNALHDARRRFKVNWDVVYRGQV
jgi:hypothetical protein